MSIKLKADIRDSGIVLTWNKYRSVDEYYVWSYTGPLPNPPASAWTSKVVRGCSAVIPIPNCDRVVLKVSVRQTISHHVFSNLVRLGCRDTRILSESPFSGFSTTCSPILPPTTTPIRASISSVTPSVTVVANYGPVRERSVPHYIRCEISPPLEENGEDPTNPMDVDPDLPIIVDDVIRHETPALRDSVDSSNTQSEPILSATPVEKDDVCIVCYEEKRSHLFVPCGHFMFCGKCSDLIFKNKGDCPYCRTAVLGWNKVFS